MKVSVLLPVYNASATLSVAIESILAQDFAFWELVIVDDGSTDGSFALATSYAEEDDRIQVHSSNHQGIALALNLGLSLCQGDYIARMDADDYAFSKRLSMQSAYLDRHENIGVVAAQVEYGGDAECNEGYARYVDWSNSLCAPDALYSARFVESPLAHPSVMFRRALCGEHGAYTARAWPEDYELWLRWMEQGVLFAKLPQLLLKWNDSPTRLSRTATEYAATAFFECKAFYLARWLKAAGKVERPIYVWGAGRVSRKRASLLELEGIRIGGYVDVDPGKVGKVYEGKSVISMEAVPIPSECYVLSYVSSRGAGAKIAAFLESRGFCVNGDYLLCA